MRKNYLALTTAVMFIAFATVGQPSEARVVKFVVQQQSSFLGGADWGNVGPYEMLRGTAYLDVDPRDPRDAVVVDLGNAPRNAQGMVDFSTPFLILTPVNPQRGNHKIFYAVNNRGNNLEGLLTATTAA
ncbi:MAG: hypothetical protein WA709_22710, partial [Stellaceae bacterium]